MLSNQVAQKEITIRDDHSGTARGRCEGRPGNQTRAAFSCVLTNRAYLSGVLAVDLPSAGLPRGWPGGQ